MMHHFDPERALGLIELRAWDRERRQRWRPCLEHRDQRGVGVPLLVLPLDARGVAGQRAAHHPGGGVRPALAQDEVRHQVPRLPALAERRPVRAGLVSSAASAARTQIELGRDPDLAQARDEALIVRHRVRVAVESEHDDGAGRLGRRDDRALDRAQSREQAGDANRKAGRWDPPDLFRGSARSARRGRHSARRRRPSRSGPAGRHRRASRTSARPRRPDRCNIRDRARRSDRSGLRSSSYEAATASSAIVRSSSKPCRPVGPSSTFSESHSRRAEFVPAWARNVSGS